MPHSFDKLFERLQIKDKKGLRYFKQKEVWAQSFPFRVIRALENIEPYAFYSFEIENDKDRMPTSTPLILFIDNSENIENIDVKKLYDIWNSQIPIAIIDNGNEWQVYNGYLLNEEENRKIEPLLGVTNYKNLKPTESSKIDIFSYLNIHSGKLWKDIGTKFLEDKHRKRLDTFLLENIASAMECLTKGKDKIVSDESRDIANNIIGRLIFARYLIDRKVGLGYHKIEKKTARKDFEKIIPNKNQLFDFFTYLRRSDRFNGDLFPFIKNKASNKDLFKKYKGELDNLFPSAISEAEKIEVLYEYDLLNEKHLQIIYALFVGENVEQSIKGQLSFVSLFDIYNFDIIPVELISNIYEQFIGKERQDIAKSFYTPPFLVDYVLKYTIEPYLDNCEQDSTKQTNCKVLDPACGSGIFLVETLRKIIEKNLSSAYLKPYAQLCEEAKGNEDLLKKLERTNNNKLESIVIENIFGIDKDPKAINIAIFSIYITLLDYKEPKEIENYTLPKLTGNFINDNFFNSEIDNMLKKHEFDFILGNPPWGSIKDDDLHYKFVEDNKDKINDYQIAQSFVVKVKQLCEAKAQCAMVLPSKILYNSGALKFRQFLLNNYKLNRVLELSAVREHLFSGSRAPSIILFFEHLFENSKQNNIVHHISIKPNRYFFLFKAIVIEKYDYKKVPQKLFENDWIWKVLLYGNKLDYDFIKQFRNSILTTNLTDFLGDNELFMGAGFIVGEKNRKADASILKKKKLLIPKNFKQFYIPTELTSFEEEFPEIDKVKDLGRIRAYNGPHLLFKRGVYKKSIVGYSDFKCVFPNTVYGIAGTKEQIPILKSLGAFFSTFLFSYLMFYTSSQWGVERCEVYKEDYEKAPILPLAENQRKYLAEKFDLACSIAAKKYHNQISNEEEYSFDKDFIDIYNINIEEQSLIDYVVNVSIPLFKLDESGKKIFSKSLGPLRLVRKNDLEKYAHVFKEFFDEEFLDMGKFFKAEVYYKRQDFVKIEFKVVDTKSDNFIEYPEENQFNFIDELLAEPEKITEHLFIQKDVKGFTPHSFYVVKPNEYKNWHPAIAYLDAYEIHDMIMKAGRDKMKGMQNNE
ncbi:MAG: N-6 DNA methylase [Ignavibacteriales bacterium]|nr:N-6 DNA methylase [Ignavibacteriales bacterium]